MNRIKASRELNDVERNILVQLSHAGNSLASDIGSNLGIKDETLYDALFYLKEDGLVRYKIDGREMRDIDIYITRKGHNSVPCSHL